MVVADQQLSLDTILYFGCRSASSDLFYASEWSHCRNLGVRVEVAASRDQHEKVYVQSLIRKDKALIKEWIVDRKGYLYISGWVIVHGQHLITNFLLTVCRSSNTMPREVREAIAWCISEDGAGDTNYEAAKAYVERMFDERRAGEESW